MCSCTCLFLCPLQEWPSPSWCCLPVWTRAPTPGSTQLSPAVCLENCKTCYTVGHGPAAGDLCLTTPPPRTLPPPRTTCTDSGRWDWKRHADWCLKRRAWVHTHLLQGHAVADNYGSISGADSTDLHQMFPTTKDSCTVSKTSICNHLSFPLHQ